MWEQNGPPNWVLVFQTVNPPRIPETETAPAVPQSPPCGGGPGARDTSPPAAAACLHAATSGPAWGLVALRNRSKPLLPEGDSFCAQSTIRLVNAEVLAGLASGAASECPQGSRLPSWRVFPVTHLPVLSVGSLCSPLGTVLGTGRAFMEPTVQGRDGTRRRAQNARGRTRDKASDGAPWEHVKEAWRGCGFGGMAGLPWGGDT